MNSFIVCVNTLSKMTMHRYKDHLYREREREGEREKEREKSMKAEVSALIIVSTHHKVCNIIE